MSGSGVSTSVKRTRVLNAVPLQNAVLCAQCDVVSDSPHDVCMVCGSHSLLNIARVFGGNLQKERAKLVLREVVEISSRALVLPFPKPHRIRRKATVAPRQLVVVARDDHDADEVDRGMLLGPKGR